MNTEQLAADLDRAIAQIRRVLKRGGRFLVTSPSRFFHSINMGFSSRPTVSSRPRAISALGGPAARPLADASTFTVRDLTPVIEHKAFDRIGFAYIMPPFESRVGPCLRPIVDRVERSPLKFFGMALVLAFRKSPAVG
jgi:ubiquinone/menaquinone biosynthesis C-methylase UbiE